MERISSSQTVLIKRVVPSLLVFAVIFAAVGAYAAVENAAAGTRSIHAPPLIVAVLTPVFMLAFGAFVYLKFVRNLADSVDETGNDLVVRRGNLQGRIALDDIVNVNVKGYSNQARIALRLRSHAPFGDEIVFIPKARFHLNPLHRNEVAERLIFRVDEVRRSRGLNED